MLLRCGRVAQSVGEVSCKKAHAVQKAQIPAIHKTDTRRDHLGGVVANVLAKGGSSLFMKECQSYSERCVQVGLAVRIARVEKVAGRPKYM